MEFNKKQAIYLQIADHICDGIILETWGDGDKIGSVREMAMNLQVNPNTVMRSYSQLQEEGILENRRGIGFFVPPEAREKISVKKRAQFIERELPELFSNAKILDISIDQLKQYYTNYLEGKKI